MATDSLGTLTIDLIANTGGFERGMDRAERSIAGQRKALASLRAEFDPTLAAYDRLERKQDQLNRLFKNGGIDADEFKNLSTAIESARQSVDATTVAYGKNGMSAKQLAANLRGVPAQFTDIAASLAAGQNPLTVFLQQGGQLKDMFGGIGPAAKALGGYVAGLVNPFTVAAAAAGTLAVAYYQGSKEADEYRKAIILNGNAAGTTASQLGSMAQAVSKSSGTVGAASEVLAALASSGKIASDNFQSIATAALKMEDQAGVAIKDTIKQFERLAQDPVKASRELNEQLNYLTAAQYEQIQAMAEQGDTLGAASLAEQVYASALSDRADEMRASLGVVETAWDEVAKAAKSAWDAVLDVGREDTLEQKLDKLSDRLSRARGAQGLPVFLGVDNPDLGLLGEDGTGVQKDIATALQQYQDESEKAWRQLMENKAQQDAIAGLDTLHQEYESSITQAERLQSRMEKLAQARTKAVSQGAWNDQDEEQYQTAFDRLQQQYGEVTAPKETRTAAVREDAGAKMLDNLRQQYAALQQQQEAGEKLGVQAQALARWEQQLADLKEKGTLTAEQKSLLANQDLITAQLKRNVAAEQELKIRQENAKVLAYQDSLTSKLQSQREGYDTQLAGLGESDKERQRIQEQLRLEQEYQKQREQLSRQATLGPGNGGISQSQYQQQLQALDSYHQAAIASQQDYYAQLDEAQSDWTLGAKSAYENYLESAKDVAGQTKSLFESAFGGMEDAIVQFATTGKLSFSDFAKSILADMARIAARQAATGILSSAVSTVAGLWTGGATSAGSTTAGYSSTYFPQAKGGAWADGIQMFAKGGAFTNSIVSQPTLFPFAKGTGLMGEAGPEAIMPLTRGSDGSLGVRAQLDGVTGGATQINVEVNIASDGTSQVSSDDATANQFGRELGTFVEQKYRELLSRDLRRDGAIGRAING